MYFGIAVVVVLGVIVWIARVGRDKSVVTDRKEMRRLSKKIQSQESYRPCGKD